MKASASLPSTTWDQLVRQLGLVQPASAPVPRRASGSTMPSTSMEELMKTSCKDGERTPHLLKLMGSLLASGFDLDESIKHCHRWNKSNLPPLPAAKIESTCASIHSSDQQNHPERYQHLLTNKPLFNLSAGRIGRYLNSAPSPRRWLVKDLVVLGKVGAVVAPGGSSKSQWMLQLAVSVASGIPLADHWEIGETGGALVFCAEDDDDEIHRRLHRIQSHLTMKGHAKDLAGLDQRLFVFSTIGTDTLLTKKGPTGEVSATVTVERIAALARQVPDLRLIVIDPASRFRGGEENSNEDATRFVEALESLAQQTGATVLLAHHANKYSSSTGDVSQGASRGASALTDGLRWQMNMNRPTDAQAKAFGVSMDVLGSFVAATVTKTNYSAIPAAVLLERVQDGYLSAVNATQARQSAEQKAIVAVLRVLDNQERPISARRLEDDYGGVKKTLQMSKQSVREALKLAADRGYVQGGERKPLVITLAGADWLKLFPPAAADASRVSKNAPRIKTQ
ncbi:MAG: helicase RepA family protein [Pseudomonadota bacterium]